MGESGRLRASWLGEPVPSSLHGGMDRGQVIGLDRTSEIAGVEIEAWEGEGGTLLLEPPDPSPPLPPPEIPEKVKPAAIGLPQIGNTPTVLTSGPIPDSELGEDERIVRTLERYQAFKAHLDKWYHGIDHQAVLICLSACVGHLFKGDEPVWVFLLGPSATAKTVTINLLASIPGTYVLGDLTPQTLLSGFDRGKKSSLLHRMGPTPMILFKDFTTLASKRYDDIKQIGTQLREVYDGEFHKDTGTGKSIQWKGKATVVAAGTPAVEHIWTQMRDMGERFMTVRWPRGDGIKQGEAALRQIGFESQIKVDGNKLLLEFLDQGSLTPAEIPDILGEHRDLLYLAELIALVRASASRDSGGAREINNVTQCEGPSRIMKSMAQTARGHATVFRRMKCNAEDIAAARRLGMDTLPDLKRKVFEVIPNDYELDLEDISERSGLPIETCKRACEDMVASGVLKQSGSGTTKYYEFKESFQAVLKGAFPGGRVVKG